MTRLVLRPIGLRLGLAILACLAWPRLAHAQMIQIEAESFVACHDIAEMAITPAAYFLRGLDCPDEWAEYEIEVSDPAYYTVQMLARAELDQSCTLRAIFTPADSTGTQACDLTYVGTGMT